jgi:hypothetical protein
MIQTATAIASADTQRMMSGRTGIAETLLDKTDPIRSEPTIAHAHGSAGRVAEQLVLVSFERRERLAVELERPIARSIETVHHDDKIGVDLGAALRRESFGDFLHRLVRINRDQTIRRLAAGIGGLLDVIGGRAFNEIESRVGDLAISREDSKVRRRARRTMADSHSISPAPK